jgi:hypothetical protein
MSPRPRRTAGDSEQLARINRQHSNDRRVCDQFLFAPRRLAIVSACDMHNIGETVPNESVGLSSALLQLGSGGVIAAAGGRLGYDPPDGPGFIRNGEAGRTRPSRRDGYKAPATTIWPPSRRTYHFRMPATGIVPRPPVVLGRLRLHRRLSGPVRPGSGPIDLQPTLPLIPFEHGTGQAPGTLDFDRGV